MALRNHLLVEVRPASKNTRKRLRSATLQVLESRSHLPDRGQVLLALVTFESSVERSGGILAAIGGGEHLGKVREGIGLVVENVGPLDDRNRLSREALGLSVLAAVRVDARLHLPPEPICFQ